MREHAAASPGVNVMCSLSLVTRGSMSARVEWRLRLWRDKCRIAAVVAIGTGPGLHGSIRVVRAVQRARPHVHGCEDETRSGNARGGLADPADGQRPGWVAEFGLDGFFTRTRV